MNTHTAQTPHHSVSDKVVSIHEAAVICGVSASTLKRQVSGLLAFMRP